MFAGFVAVAPSLVEELRYGLKVFEWHADEGPDDSAEYPHEDESADDCSGKKSADRAEPCCTLLCDNDPPNNEHRDGERCRDAEHDVTLGAVSLRAVLASWGIYLYLAVEDRIGQSLGDLVQRLLIGFPICFPSCAERAMGERL